VVFCWLARTGRQSVCGKKTFAYLWRHLYIKRSFYQDRLGTNIGKALNKEMRFRRMGKLGKDADRDAPTLIGMGNLGNMLAENKARSDPPALPSSSPLCVKCVVFLCAATVLAFTATCIIIAPNG
jgi:hypothetical protein